MSKKRNFAPNYALAVLLAAFALGSLSFADDAANVKKAVKRSTLNQPGTKPFHLKATLGPTRERDRSSNRTGEVEIWWNSPKKWKREVRSPEFHQVAIVDGAEEWQANEGDYFPEWLRQAAVALIDPVPYLDHTLKDVGEAEVKRLFGTTYYSWTMMSTDGNITKGMGAGIDITDSSGLLMYGGGLGWGAGYSNYKSFHNRMVARTVSVGSPEVTAQVIILEDLKNVPPDTFNAPATMTNAPLIRTEIVDETALRKNLLPSPPVDWPALKDGPLQGGITTEVVIDRSGKVREIGSILSDNPGLSQTAGKAIVAMQFKPYLLNGIPVQVVSRITMPFSTVRPEGAEKFDSARSYFELGRHAGFPAAGSGAPYEAQGTFQTKLKSGSVADGKYTDTWKSNTEWRREASIAESRYIRCQHGNVRYELAEGPDVPALKMVLKFVEPIPALDTFIESDWRIKRDTVDGIKAIRVLTGAENPDGSLDGSQARAYWFDENGKLLKTYYLGMETDRSDFSDYGGAQVARKISVIRKGEVAMVIHITNLSPAATIPDDVFVLRGHEYKRAFTDEVR
jgi:hypothetical protein